MCDTLRQSVSQSIIETEETEKNREEQRETERNRKDRDVGANQHAGPPFCMYT